MFPSDNNDFCLYEDEGTTLDYTKGKWVKTHFQSRISGEDSEILFTIEIEKGPGGMSTDVLGQRTYTLHFHGIPSSEVTLESSPESPPPKVGYETAYGISRE